MKFLKTTLLLLIVSVAPAIAQTRSDDDPRQSDRTSRRATEREEPLFDVHLKLQGLYFENFFQAPAGTEGDNVLGALGELGASLRLSRRSPLRLYGSVDYTHYDEEGLDASNGFRVGLRSDGRPHGFNVSADVEQDRPTFDVGDEFDRADVTTFSGEYTLRFADDWQAGVEGQLQEQEFDLTPTRNNDFNAVGASLRYRGWRRFSPEIGFRTGERDVEDEALSYEQGDLWLQIRSSISPALYLSVRFRDRSREYTGASVLSSNFGREDDRRQLAASADYRTSEVMTLNFYAAHEDTESNIAGKDFDTSLIAAGVTFGF